jgi:hypothetical protein
MELTSFKDREKSNTLTMGISLSYYYVFQHYFKNVSHKSIKQKTDGEIIFVGIKKKGLKIPNW